MDFSGNPNLVGPPEGRPACRGGDGPREFVLLDDDGDRPDRGTPERAVIAAVLGSVAVRVDHLRSTPTESGDGGGGVEVVVTVANVDNETSYLPVLEAAGYVLDLRIPGYRVLTLPGCGIRVHVRDDDDPAAVDAHGRGGQPPPRRWASR